MVALTLSILSLVALRVPASFAAPQNDPPPAPTPPPGAPVDFDLAGRIGGPAGTAFSETTATVAHPVASGIGVDGGKAYIKHSTVPGFFLQDLNSTVPSSFDYTAQNFGLINRTYSTDNYLSIHFQSQWQRFSAYLTSINRHSGRDTQYKLLFIGRHGQGYHNAAETFYGTPAWNCYWAEADGNSTASWADALITPDGAAQSKRAHDYWTRLLREQKIQPPQSFYSSPLRRCLQTADGTFRGLDLCGKSRYRPVIKELMREGISIHTCDRRSPKSKIAAAFPGFRFETTFTEEDELWSGVVSESSSAQDYRSKALLDDIFTSDRNQVMSFTTHSGEASSILRVLGHIPFGLSTGSVIPILVKAETIRQKPSSTTVSPWATSAWCTNKPPQTSLPGGACVCQDGVKPTAVAPSSVFKTNPARL